MIDLRGNYNPAWSGELRPIGEGTWQKEPFDKWWIETRFGWDCCIPAMRNSGFIGTGRTHRSATWTYRITWRSERRPTQRFLAEVVRPDSADETRSRRSLLGGRRSPATLSLGFLSIHHGSLLRPGHLNSA
jgi:hypothetical protein